VIEGPLNDVSAGSGTSILAADTDDVLLFTTRNPATAFLGRSGPAGGFAESTTAEVAWFLRPTVTDTTTTPISFTTNPATFTLYRRQLLVIGLAGFAPFSSNANTVPATSWSSFFDQYDISARVTASGTVTPNTLSDLTRRESRFLHSSVIATFPFPFVDHQSYPAPDGLIFTSPSSTRVGEDVVLTNVLAFDVRVFDPAAPVAISDDVAVVPGDANWGGSAVSSGAYIDLGTGTTNPLLAGLTGHFSGPCNGRSGLNTASPTLRIYDTWSTHYESNGLNENGNLVGGSPLIDEGTNGQDDNSDGVPDDPAERETSPPYPVALRGMEIAIRCYDPQSRQVRQVTVRHTFVPH